jgi:apolipoprotein N-acyltransferase
MSSFLRSGRLIYLVGLVVSAVLLGFFARGGNAYVLGFVGLVPWLLVINRTRTLRGALVDGLLMSVAMTIAGFMWFGTSISLFFNTSETAGHVILVALSPLFQPQVIAFTIARHLAGRHHGAIVRAIAGASAWVAIEWIFPKTLGDTLGYCMYPSLYFRQIADLIGAAGITVLLIFANEAITAAIELRRQGKNVRVLAKPLLGTVAIVAGMWIYGFVRLQMIATSPLEAGAPLRVGMVQGNLYNYMRLTQKMDPLDVLRLILDTHFEMSKEAVEYNRVDAVIWPETVYPLTFSKPQVKGAEVYDREVQRFIDRSGVPFVFGTLDHDAEGEYVAAAFVEPNHGPIGFYRKTHPFLFTEYTPSWLDGPLLRSIIPTAGHWKRGNGPRVMPLRLADGREIPVLPLICLDEGRPEVATEGAGMGAQVIFSLSNDSWFVQPGVDMHLALSIFRSIETRLPLLRVTPNGISASISPDGTVLEATQIGVKDLLVGEAQIRKPPTTLMVLWGDWVGQVGIATLLLLMLLWGLRVLRRRLGRQREVAAMQAAGDNGTELDPYRADAIVLAPAWRYIAAALRLFARGSLLWIGISLLLPDRTQTNTLSQLWMFAGLFLAPEIAAWALLRAFAAKARVEGENLVLEQRERRIDIRAQDIAAVRPWRLPLPSSGVSLTLATGQTWSHGIAVADPAALVAASVRAGSPAGLFETFSGRAAEYAQARAAVPPKPVIDHPLVKFVLFPLIPALVAFRLHQIIAFGGTFGEYLTYGLQAYLTGLLIWWGKWAVGLVCFATALRVVVEAGTMLMVTLKPAKAIGIRKTLEFLARLAYYLGVPLWLLIRLWL